MKIFEKKAICAAISLLLIAFFCHYKILACPGLARVDCLQAEQNLGSNKQVSQKQQRMRENIATLRLLRMTKALDLTEAQAAKIFPMANRVEKEKTELNRQLSQEIRLLRSLVAVSSPDEAKIREKVERIRELRETIRSKDAEFEVFLEKNLTAGQMGRYVLFTFDFAQFLGRNLERIRNLKGTAPPSAVKKTPEN